jgi:hypothetical protein
MTQQRRVVPEGYVDEAIIAKLMGSIGAVVNECQPTGSEIMTAAVRLVILGLHIRATNGDPSATTPEIQARLERFGEQVNELAQSAFNNLDNEGAKPWSAEDQQ